MLYVFAEHDGFIGLFGLNETTNFASVKLVGVTVIVGVTVFVGVIVGVTVIVGVGVGLGIVATQDAHPP
jgi:hypothetical protein